MAVVNYIGYNDTVYFPLTNRICYVSNSTTQSYGGSPEYFYNPQVARIEHEGAFHIGPSTINPSVTAVTGSIAGIQVINSYGNKHVEISDLSLDSVAYHVFDVARDAQGLAHLVFGQDDFFRMSDADDTIAAWSGNDTVGAAGGSDLVYGNGGDDLIYGNTGEDSIFGGQAADHIYGGQGRDVLYGNLGDDVIYGNIEGDSLFGGQGNDALYGGQGNDTLDGNVGDDQIVGGLGADLFRLMGGGADMVADYDPGEGDQLSLEGQSNVAYAVSQTHNGSLVAWTSAEGSGSVLLYGVSSEVVPLQSLFLQ